MKRRQNVDSFTKNGEKRLPSIIHPFLFQLYKCMYIVDKYINK